MTDKNRKYDYMYDWADTLVIVLKIDLKLYECTNLNFNIIWVWNIFGVQLINVYVNYMLGRCNKFGGKLQKLEIGKLAYRKIYFWVHFNYQEQMLYYMNYTGIFIQRRKRNKAIAYLNCNGFLTLAILMRISWHDTCVSQALQRGRGSTQSESSILHVIIFYM